MMILFKLFKFSLKLIKSQFTAILQSEYNFKYYKNVKFVGKKNIFINEKVYIEEGTILTSIGNEKNNHSIKIEENTWIGKDVEITTDNCKIYIGKNVTINDRCKILGNVSVKSNTLLAPDVFMSSGNHSYNLKPYLLIKEQDEINTQLTTNDNIVVEEDCWIGKNVFIKNGILIGRGSIVGANSVVTKNIPPYEIWAGIPAKLIKKRIIFKPILNLSFNIIETYPYFYEGFYRDEERKLFQSYKTSFCIVDTISKNFELQIKGHSFQSGILNISIDGINLFQLNLSEGIFIFKKDFNFDKLIDYNYNKIEFLFNPLNKNSKLYFGIKHLNIKNHD